MARGERTRSWRDRRYRRTASPVGPRASPGDPAAWPGLRLDGRAQRALRPDRPFRLRGGQARRRRIGAFGHSPQAATRHLPTVADAVWRGGRRSGRPYRAWSRAGPRPAGARWRARDALGQRPEPAQPATRGRRRHCLRGSSVSPGHASGPDLGCRGRREHPAARAGLPHRHAGCRGNRTRSGRGELHCTAGRVGQL